MKGTNCVAIILILVTTIDVMEAQPAYTSIAHLKYLINRAKSETVSRRYYSLFHQRNGRQLLPSIVQIDPNGQGDAPSGMQLYVKMEREVSNFRCDLMMKCYLKTWFLRSVLLIFNETQPGSIEGTYEDYVSLNNMMMLLVKQYIDAEVFPYLERFQIDIYPECTDDYLKRCQNHLAQFTLKVCEDTLKLERKDLNCMLNHTLSDWAILQIIKDYVEDDDKVSLPKVDFYMSQVKPDQSFCISNIDSVKILSFLFLLCFLVRRREPQ